VIFHCCADTADCQIVSHTSGIIMMPDNAIWSAIRISRSFLAFALALAIFVGHTTQWQSVTAALDTWKIEETAWRPPFVGSFNFCRRDFCLPIGWLKMHFKKIPKIGIGYGESYQTYSQWTEFLSL